MELVRDLHHFDILVNEFTKTEKNTISNCFLLPDNITKITQQKHLFWERNNNGLLFFHEKQDFYNLYFNFSKGNISFTPIISLNQNKPVTIDLVYIESRKTQGILEIQDYWLKNGFTVFTHYRQTSMENPLNENMPDLQIHLDNSKYKITFAKQEQYQEIQQMWRNNLGVYSAMLPFEEELIDLLRNKQAYCVLDQENRIAATQQIQRNGKTCILSHGICVESHRRHGLVRALLHTCFNANKDVKKYISWVDEKNSAARLFHKNIGLAYDGRVSCQMILE